MSRLATAVLALTLIGAPTMAEEFGIPNEKHPEDGVVFGGQPTAEQFEAMSKAGFKTVIDLRGAGEDRGLDEKAILEKDGMKYVPIEVTRETTDDAANWESVFDAFENAEKPVLVHCASGNRVGAFYYGWLASRKDVPRDEALATARENGLRSDALVEAMNSILDQQ